MVAKLSNNYHVLFFDKQDGQSDDKFDIRLLQPNSLFAIIRPIDYIHLKMFYANILVLFIENQLAGYVISYKYPFYRCGLDGSLFRELSFHVFNLYRGKRLCQAFVRSAILANERDGYASYCFIKQDNFSSLNALQRISFSSLPCTRTKRVLVSRYKFDHSVLNPDKIF